MVGQKRYIVSAGILLSIIFAAAADANFLLTRRDGITFSWPNYTDDGSNYCMSRSSGEFCISKDQIASIREVAGSASSEDSGSARFVGPDVDTGRPSKVAASKRAVNTRPKPADDDPLVVEAEKTCRDALMGLDLHVQVTEGIRTYTVTKVDKRSVLNYSVSGYRFCFTAYAFKPDEKVGINWDFLCTIEGGEFAMKRECSFME